MSGVVGAGDTAFVDSSLYLAVRPLAKEAYYGLSEWDVVQRMPAEQKRAIDLLIARPSEAALLRQGLGGAWRATGAVYHPRGKGIFEGRNFGFLSMQGYDYVVYRRAER